jgi:hypothetical protein
VRLGARYSLGAGSILVEACEPVPAAAIRDEDARIAGFSSREALLKAAAHRRPAGLAFPDLLYRIEFRYEAVRPQGRNTETLSDDDAVTLTRKLEAMDTRSAGGPWTWATLREIGDNPGLVSTALAINLGRERFRLKADIRKLKALGLTISLLVGYELSPRGQALLDRHDASS